MAPDGHVGDVLDAPTDGELAVEAATIDADNYVEAEQLQKAIDASLVSKAADDDNEEWDATNLQKSIDASLLSKELDAANDEIEAEQLQQSIDASLLSKDSDEAGRVSKDAELLQMTIDASKCHKELEDVTTHIEERKMKKAVWESIVSQNEWEERAKANKSSGSSSSSRTCGLTRGRSSADIGTALGTSSPEPVPKRARVDESPTST